MELFISFFGMIHILGLRTVKFEITVALTSIINDFYYCAPSSSADKLFSVCLLMGE
jgi:hypothetical protein